MSSAESHLNAIRDMNAERPWHKRNIEEMDHAEAALGAVTRATTQLEAIHTALRLGQVREVNGGELEPIETIYTTEGVVLVQAQAIRDALALAVEALGALRQPQENT